MGYFFSTAQFWSKAHVLRQGLKLMPQSSVGTVFLLGFTTYSPTCPFSVETGQNSKQKSINLPKAWGSASSITNSRRVYLPRESERIKMHPSVSCTHSATWKETYSVRSAELVLFACGEKSRGGNEELRDEWFVLIVVRNYYSITMFFNSDAIKINSAPYVCIGGEKNRFFGDKQLFDLQTKTLVPATFLLRSMIQSADGDEGGRIFHNVKCRNNQTHNNATQRTNCSGRNSRKWTFFTLLLLRHELSGERFSFFFCPPTVRY